MTTTLSRSVGVFTLFFCFAAEAAWDCKSVLVHQPNGEQLFKVREDVAQKWSPQEIEQIAEAVNSNKATTRTLVKIFNDHHLSVTVEEAILIASEIKKGTVSFRQYRKRREKGQNVPLALYGEKSSNPSKTRQPEIKNEQPHDRLEIIRAEQIRQLTSKGIDQADAEDLVGSLRRLNSTVLGKFLTWIFAVHLIDERERNPQKIIEKYILFREFGLSHPESKKMAHSHYEFQQYFELASVATHEEILDLFKEYEPTEEYLQVRRQGIDHKEALEVILEYSATDYLEARNVINRFSDEPSTQHRHALEFIDGWYKAQDYATLREKGISHSKTIEVLEEGEEDEFLALLQGGMTPETALRFLDLE